ILSVESRTAPVPAIARAGLEPWLPAVVWAWLTGVAALIVRFAGGCWRVHRLHVAALAAAPSPWQRVAERVAGRLRIGRAGRVVESAVVDVPSVIGAMRPIILMPAAMLTNLTPGQIEALLAHELAHIRRHDYAVNVVQTIAETLLFFHPAVWWI